MPTQISLGDPYEIWMWSKWTRRQLKKKSAIFLSEKLMVETWYRRLVDYLYIGPVMPVMMQGFPCHGETVVYLLYTVTNFRGTSWTFITQTIAQLVIQFQENDREMHWVVQKAPYFLSALNIKYGDFFTTMYISASFFAVFMQTSFNYLYNSKAVIVSLKKYAIRPHQSFPYDS